MCTVQRPGNPQGPTSIWPNVSKLAAHSFFSPLTTSGLSNPQRLERYLQHLWHPWGGRHLPQQGSLPARALHDQILRRLLQVPVHPVRRRLQNVRGQGICQSPVEDLPGGSGHKVSLDSFKWAAHHENRTYCLSRGQSANQVYQLCTKLNCDYEGLFPKKWCEIWGVYVFTSKSKGFGSTQVFLGNKGCVLMWREKRFFWICVHVVFWHELYIL